MNYFFFLHIITDLFAAGRSDVKVFLFLFAILLLAVVNIIAWRKKIAVETPVARKFPLKNIFFIVSTAIFLLGLGVTFYFYKMLAVPANYVLSAIGERDISTTHFFHTHVLKFPFGLVSSFFPTQLRLALETKADFGFAYLNILPTWVGWVGLAGCLTVSILGIWLLFDFVGKNKKRFGLQILFAIALLSFLKNIFDGGLLNSEAIPAFLILLVMCYGYAPKSFRGWIFPVALSLVTPIAVIIAYPFGAISHTQVSVYLEHVFGMELVYFGWFFLAERGASRFRVFGATAVLLLGICFLVPVFVSTEGDISYDTTSIAYQNVYLGTYDASAPGRFLEKIGDLYFYDIATTSPVTIGNIAKETGDPTNRFPISFDNVVCDNWRVNATSTLFVVSKEPLVKPAATHSLANISDIHLFGQKNGWNYYAVTFDYFICIPRIVDVESELLILAGGIHTVEAFPVNNFVVTY